MPPHYFFPPRESLVVISCPSIPPSIFTPPQIPPNPPQSPPNHCSPIQLAAHATCHPIRISLGKEKREKRKEAWHLLAVLPFQTINMTSYPAPTGYAPSYSWIGAPTAFNGTNPLSGGDSGQSTFNLHTPFAQDPSTPPACSGSGITE